jgi:excisionase family DNA binding protein
MEKPDRLLPVSVVAARLNLSENSVRRLMKQGQLRCIATGPVKGYKIRESSVAAFLMTRGME